MNGKTADSEFIARVEQSGLRDLDPGDLAALRAAFDRNSRPMALPQGFSPVTPPFMHPAMPETSGNEPG